MFRRMRCPTPGGTANACVRNVDEAETNVPRNQAKIAALTRAKHQTVRPEAHRLTVAIGCPVMDLERDQRKLRHERLEGALLLAAAPRKYRVADDDSYWHVQD